MTQSQDVLEFEIGQVVEAKGRQWYVAEKRGVTGENGAQTSVYRLKSISGVHAEWFVIPEIEALTHPMRVTKLPPPEPIIGHPFSQSLLVQAYRYTLRNDSLALTCLRNARVIPENYQLVPVLMALKQQDKVRMLIADGVGLGKTVEALLIVSELYNKEIAERILIVCPANIREQWKNSLKRFFNIDGVIIDSTSRRKLESQMMVDQNVWNYYDVVIVSIDYLKQIYVLGEVIQYDWDLVIIDEAHNCGMPHNYFRKGDIFGEAKISGGVNLAKARKYLDLMNDRYKKLNEKIKEKSDGRMSRKQLENQFRRKQEKEAYEMALILASKVNHLLLLTATPHNGFTDSFGSLLHLLDEKCVRFDGTDISIDKARARNHVCQRTYALIKDEIENKDIFPEVDEAVVYIDINQEFHDLVQDIKDYCGCLIHFFKLHESDSKMQYPNMRIIMNWIINNLHKRLISSPYALYSSVLKMVAQKKADIENRESKAKDIMADWTAEELGYQQDQITRNLFDVDVDVEENEDEVDEALVKNFIRVPLEYEKVSLPYLEILATNANQFMGKLGLVIQDVVRSMETEEILGDDDKTTYADHLKTVLKRHGIDFAQKAHRETFKEKIINNLLDTKMKRLLTLVPEVTLKTKSKKVIVFTRFIDTLSYVEFYLQIAKLLEMPFFTSTNVFSINGKQPVYVREQVYNEFRRTDSGILVATDCMAEGIDLQYSANILFNYELTWNPNRIEQRNGRINRFGQPEKMVYLRLLVLKHAIEQKILSIIQAKIQAMKNDVGLIPSFFQQTIDLNESFEVDKEVIDLLNRRDFSSKDKRDMAEQKRIDEYIDAAILTSFQRQIGLADETQMKRILDESFYGQETVKISQVKEKMTEFTHRYGKPSELLEFLKTGLEKYGLCLEPVPEKGDVFKLSPGLNKEVYEEFMDELNMPRDQPVLVTTNPIIGARRRDIEELKLNSPVITTLIDKLKRDCFSDQEAFYGRVVVRGIPQDAFKSHVIELNVLYRFAVHMKKPVVFEELHPIAMQLRPEAILDATGLDALHALKALNSTLADGEKCKAFIEQSLKSPVLTGAIEAFKENRRQELVKEREAFWNQLEATQVVPGEKGEFLDVRAPSWDVLTITLHTREIAG